MEEIYSKLKTEFINHEKITGRVEVLFVSEEYNTKEKYVIYREIHTGKIGNIKLSEWDERIDMAKGNEFINKRPRFYSVL